MEYHKKVLGILFVVLASFQLLAMVFVSLILSTILTLAISQAEPKDARVLELVTTIVRYIPAVVIIFLALPGLVAGIGLLTKQKWGIIFALIIGCLNLFSFPFGTALGIYTIWVYSEDQRQSKLSPHG